MKGSGVRENRGYCCDGHFRAACSGPKKALDGVRGITDSHVNAVPTEGARGQWPAIPLGEAFVWSH